MNIRNRWPDKLENNRVDALIMLLDMRPLQEQIEEANRAGDKVMVARANVAIEGKRERAIAMLQEMKRLTKVPV